METSAEIFRPPETLDEHYAEIGRLIHTIADECSGLDNEWDYDELTTVRLSLKPIEKGNKLYFLAFIMPRHLANMPLDEYGISLSEVPELYILADDGKYFDTIKLGDEKALEHAGYVMDLLRSGIVRADGDDTEERFGNMVQDYAIDQVPRSVVYLARFQNQLIIEQYADNIVDPQSTSKPESSQRWRLNKDALRTRLDTRIAEQVARLSKIQRAIGATSVFLTSGMLKNETPKND